MKLSASRPRSFVLTALTFVGVSSLSFGPETARADAIVKVDFGAQVGDTQPLLEDGFLAAFWSFPTDNWKLETETLSILDPSIPSGSLVLTLGSNLSFTDTGNMNMRRRSTPSDAGDFTYGDLLKDRIVSISGQGLFLRLTGLQPNTEFQIQVWGYDNAKAGNFELLDRTDGKNQSLGSFNVAAGALPKGNDDFSVIGIVTSDANGTIIVQSNSSIDGTGVMNGFVLSSVPEPTTALTLLGGVGVLLSASRFRRSRQGL